MLINRISCERYACSETSNLDMLARILCRMPNGASVSGVEV